MVIQVDLGRNYQDGTWHVEWINLVEAVQKALDDYDGSFGSINKAEWKIIKAERILISGPRFKLDDIMSLR